MKTATASGMVLLGVSAVLAQVDRVIATAQTEKSLRDVAAEPPPAARGSAPDTDWYQFQFVAGPKSASVFVYSNFGVPLHWQLYQASAGCGAGIQRVQVVPCFPSSQKTFCPPHGTYWLRIAPEEDVKCGREYARFGGVPGLLVLRRDLPDAQHAGERGARGSDSRL